MVAPTFARPNAAADELAITWLGHSTALIQIGGLNVLTDPVWADRASPVAFLGPRRRLPPAIALSDMPPIDVVVISHNHYDHLDLSTVRRIVERSSDTVWFAPLGVGNHIRRAGAVRVFEQGWWEQRVIGGIAVECVPAQHSSGRGITDRNRTLWCGWVVTAVEGPRRAVYFAGDTAYCPAFIEIGSRCGPFDACLLPIGAYEPRWYMQYVHITPEEAVRAYEELCAGMVERSTFVPIHWGTFRIADEALEEAPRRLRDEWRALGFPPDALAMLGHGETRRYGSRS